MERKFLKIYVVHHNLTRSPFPQSMPLIPQIFINLFKIQMTEFTGLITALGQPNPLSLCGVCFLALGCLNKQLLKLSMSSGWIHFFKKTRTREPFNTNMHEGKEFNRGVVVSKLVFGNSFQKLKCHFCPLSSSPCSVSQMKAVTTCNDMCCTTNPPSLNTVEPRLSFSPHPNHPRLLWFHIFLGGVSQAQRAYAITSPSCHLIYLYWAL